MELIINLGLLIAFVFGMILLFLSIFVLHTYEAETKKRPASIQFWPFNKELQEFYPSLTKAGKFLQISTLVCVLPYLVKLLIST